MKIYIYIANAAVVLNTEGSYSGFSLQTSNKYIPDTWVLLKTLEVDIEPLREQLTEIATGQLEVAKTRVIEEYSTKLKEIQDSLDTLKAIEYKPNVD